jgi:hypothetical protein
MITLRHDPHAPPPPEHAQTPAGGWVYDPRCWMCREVTAQPPPTAKGAGS